MRSAGIRELKNRLSEYLRRVRAGESVQVTDRGEIVAELTPPGRSEDSAHAGVSVLVRKGLATAGDAADPGLYCRLPRSGPRQMTSSRLLDEERGLR
ncbi:MAG TPA: type II toxin-antitoxin system prevent-host-death family antitoxin [Steroidobacteraceae bacterium]|nr:type II toxin-antitoxin system prevent-host-death family antitoxin [Steroidobacteraceae bacterium]